MENRLCYYTNVAPSQTRDYEYKFGVPTGGGFNPSQTLQMIHDYQNDGYELFWVDDVNKSKKYLFRRDNG